MLEDYDRGRPMRSVAYPVQAIRFDSGLAIVALGGEVVVDYALRAKREHPNLDLVVAGYSNAVMSYIPSLRVLREGGYDPRERYQESDALRLTLDEIAHGRFCRGQPDRYRAVVDSLLLYGDHYLLLADYASYLDAHDRVDALRRDPLQWTRTAIANVAAMGPFSSDRTVRQYADDIWSVRPVAR